MGQPGQVRAVEQVVLGRLHAGRDTSENVSLLLPYPVRASHDLSINRMPDERLWKNLSQTGAGHVSDV